MNSEQQDLFLTEILSQPSIVRSILDRCKEDDAFLQPLSDLADGEYDLIILTGMGSSFYALYPGCIYLHERGVPAVLLETSELLHHHQGLITSRALLVIVSQSGETVEATNLLMQVGFRAPVVSITSNLESSVARLSHLRLLLDIGREEGPASKSYTGSLALMLACATVLARIRDEQLSNQLYSGVEAMERALEGWENRVDRLAGAIGRADCMTLLGRGPSLASAAAGSLILNEVAKVKAAAMSCGQFRHGPLEVAGPGFVAIIFASGGRAQMLNQRLASDIARFGGKVALIGGDEQPPLDNIVHLPLSFPGELAAPLVEIVPLQLLARKMALDRGLQPGRFVQAGKVTLSE